MKFGGFALLALGSSILQARSAAEFSWTPLSPLPEVIGVAGPFGGVSGDALLVAGGANFPQGLPWEGGKKAWHDLVYRLAQAEGQWSAAGHLPRPLAYGVSVTTEDGVVCVGGGDAERHYAETFRMKWDGTALTFESLPKLPIPLAFASGAQLSRTIHVYGGSTEPGEKAAVSRLFALDLSAPNPAWTELEPCPGKPRILPVAAVQAGAFFVVGGCALEPVNGQSTRVYLRDGWRYQPGQGWRPIADLPHPVTAAPSPAPALGQSHFLVMGGDDGSKVGFEPLAQHPGFPGEILAYHTITDTWTPMGKMPAPRVTVPLVKWNQQFVIPSGEMRPGVRSPEVWSLAVGNSKAGFGWLNYSTLSLYLLGVVWLGASFAKRNKTTNDYFRGGQRVPWWAVGLSIFATMLSSITFMAIPAQGYSVGWNLFLGNSYLLLTPLVVLVYLPFYRRLNVTTAYEYLEQRFNVATRLVASALFIVFQLGRVAIVLYLPALALATVSNFDVATCILAMGLLVIVYTVMGGIEAVIWTDAVQAIILMGGALWALVTIILRLDGGVSELISTTSAQGKFFESVPWNLDFTIGAGWVILVGSIFANLFSYTASQDVVQRYVTTADQKGAAKAIWTNMAIAPLAQGLFFAIGSALFVFYRHHPDKLDPTLQNDAIFPLFIVRELPVGVAGIIVAGILAAAQSTLSSSLNSIATAYVTDFHRRFRPTVSDRSCLRLARWLTALVGLTGIAVALIMASFNIRSLWETFLAVIGLFGGTVSGLFVLGIFSRRASGSGALVGAVASAILVFLVKEFTGAHFFCYPVVGVLSCVMIGWLVSLLLPPQQNDLQGLTLQTLDPKPGLSRHRSTDPVAL